MGDSLCSWRSRTAIFGLIRALKARIVHVNHGKLSTAAYPFAFPLDYNEEIDKEVANVSTGTLNWGSCMQGFVEFCDLIPVMQWYGYGCIRSMQSFLKFRKRMQSFAGGCYGMLRSVTV